ncbi:hypothetical protein DNH61_05495 [Paenibacillus sambharensis]|uniref:Uncharacterized protein n=2 Tax=Paenibacillus sambharensis TaxID=1803190 RepID=A0A2W1LDC7_9BACL|nr:hypothetical protein DNH61_05495 [Paenibacillus sambharensis]
MDCFAIVDEMIKEFDISREEAILRLNLHWGTEDLPDSVFEYYSPLEMAQMIYFGPEKQWWRKDNKTALTPRTLK